MKNATIKLSIPDSWSWDSRDLDQQGSRPARPTPGPAALQWLLELPGRRLPQAAHPNNLGPRLPGFHHLPPLGATTAKLYKVSSNKNVDLALELLENPQSADVLRLTASSGKEFTCQAGDVRSIHGWGRSPGEGTSNPLQYSHPGNPMDKGAWRATVYGITESDTS